MNGIQDLLNQILSAVYGRDVRQSIHDAIKKCYEDGTAAGNSNMEVSNARGTDADLKTRLDRMQQEMDTVEAEVIAARGSQPNVNTRLSQMMNRTQTNTTEITTARGGQANLKAKLDLMDTATTTNTSEITTARGTKANLNERLTEIEARQQPSLWTGTFYMQDTQTITPTKPLNQCRNGWILVWSDYDPGTQTANNYDWAYTYVPKTAVLNQHTMFAIPRNLESTTDPKVTNKSLRFTNTTITGHANNRIDAPVYNTDVVLREVREW